MPITIIFKYNAPSTITKTKIYQKTCWKINIKFKTKLSIDSKILVKTKGT